MISGGKDSNFLTCPEKKMQSFLKKLCIFCLKPLQLFKKARESLEKGIIAEKSNKPYKLHSR